MGDQSHQFGESKEAMSLSPGGHWPVTAWAVCVCVRVYKGYRNPAPLS